VKEVFIIAGPNGSGKSTFATQFIEKCQLSFINADDIAKEMDSNQIHKVRIKAGKQFFKEINDKITKGDSFIVESTLSGHYLNKFLIRLKKEGYEITIIFIFLHTIVESIERIRIRVQKGGHFIPDEDVIRRFPRSIKNFWNMYREQCHYWKLFYNGKGSFKPIALGSDRQITLLDHDIFDEFKEIVDG